MDRLIFSIIYVTLYLVLSVALYVVIIPSKNEYNDYKKSRRILGFGFLLIASAGIIRLLCFPPTKEVSFIGQFAVTCLSLIFNSLNYISFLYLIETSRPKRKVLKKITLVCLIMILVLGAVGLMIPQTQFFAKIFMSTIYVFTCVVLFTGSIREYDKFILQMDNFYEDDLNIKWIPGMLWATFAIALTMTMSFHYRHISFITGVAGAIVYTFITMKMLSFLPQNIHVVRRNIKSHDIIYEDHGEHLHIFPIDGPIEENNTTDENNPKPSDIILDKDAKRNEKVATLMEKWINLELYTQSEITIKDVASEMGTNSNYLSVYINKVLDTSFATWLNSLRVEKSKEYLCGSERISVEECGIKVGYTSLYNYSRWFKTITGMSPSEWRKSQCGNSRIS